MTVHSKFVVGFKINHNEVLPLELVGRCARPIGMSALLPVLSLVAFLQRHIHTVPHDSLLLVFNTSTEIEAGVIAAGLAAVTASVVCINHSSSKPRPFEPSRKALVISLIVDLVQFDQVVGCLHKFNYKDDQFKKFIFVANASFPLTIHQTMKKQRNAFYVMVYEDRIEFVVWYFVEDLSPKTVSELIWLPDEAKFVESDYWQTFCGRLERLPPDVVLMEVISNAGAPILQSYVSYQGEDFITGASVGVGLLVKERLEVKRQVYMWTQATSPVRKPVRFLDRRLTTRWAGREKNAIYIWSTVLFANNEWTSALLNRYVVLAPQEKVPVQGSFLSALGLSHQKVFVVGTLVAIATGFSLLRLSYRSAARSCTQFELDYLLFDTIARLLGIQPGLSRIGFAAERLLLSVIAVLAILVSSMFSGALFEERVRTDIRQRYNSLKDLCANRVPIMMPGYLRLQDHLMEGSWLCDTKYPDTDQVRNWTGAAMVLVEHLAGIMMEAGKHHMLAEPFATHPVPLFVTHWFLEHPIRRTLDLISDHGIKKALLTAAHQAASLRSARKMAVELATKDSTQTIGDLEFQNAVLVFGWTSASLVFVGEIIAGWRK